MDITPILLGVYAFIVVGVFAFLVLFFVQLKKICEFIPYIIPVFRGFLLILIVIWVFWVYKILTSENTIFSENPFDISTGLRKDF